LDGAQSLREAVKPNDEPEQDFGKWRPGANSAGRLNEGVGEHVRTRFQRGIVAGETAEPSRLRTERRNLSFLLPDRFWKGNAIPKYDPAV